MVRKGNGTSFFNYRNRALVPCWRTTAEGCRADRRTDRHLQTVTVFMSPFGDRGQTDSPKPYVFISSFSAQTDSSKLSVFISPLGDRVQTDNSSLSVFMSMETAKDINGAVS